MQPEVITSPTRQRELELTLIYQTAQQITQLQSLSELLPRLVAEVSRTFNYSSMGVLLVDEETNELVVRETIGLEREKHLGFRVPVTDAVEGGICGWVAYHGQSYLVPDVLASPRYIKTVEATRAELGVPLKIKDKVIGVLDVQSLAVNGLTERDESILSTLASQIAIAVENARLYEELAQAQHEEWVHAKVSAARADTRPTMTTEEVRASLQARYERLGDASR